MKTTLFDESACVCVCACENIAIMYNKMSLKWNVLVTKCQCGYSILQDVALAVEPTQSYLVNALTMDMVSSAPENVHLTRALSFILQTGSVVVEGD